jgi:hypothetical protein
MSSTLRTVRLNCGSRGAKGREQIDRSAKPLMLKRVDPHCQRNCAWQFWALEGGGTVDIAAAHECARIDLVTRQITGQQMVRNDDQRIHISSQFPRWKFSRNAQSGASARSFGARPFVVGMPDRILTALQKKQCVDTVGTWGGLTGLMVVFHGSQIISTVRMGRDQRTAQEFTFVRRDRFGAPLSSRWRIFAKLRIARLHGPAGAKIRFSATCAISRAFTHVAAHCRTSPTSTATCLISSVAMLDQDRDNRPEQVARFKRAVIDDRRDNKAVKP